MHSLRIDGESDEDFRVRAERTARYAKILVDACLANETAREYIADPDEPLWTVEHCRRHPTVRVEFEQAIAFGGIGETLAATKSKHWGDGPYIHPLKTHDWFYPERISYLYRENSLYNRRFEQRQRMKEILGKRYRTLVERAKYRRHTLAIFLDNLRDDEIQMIERAFGVTPQVFRQACRGTKFLDLPPRLIQREFDWE